MITQFNGPHRFLSNFYPSKIEFEGMEYPTVEHAYQAAKTTNDLIRQDISTAPTPGYAKKIGRTIPIREDWDAVKVVIMKRLLNKKFRDLALLSLLQETGTEELVEGNYWHDNIWGKCFCTECLKNKVATNYLGLLLMEVRQGI